MPRPVLIYDVAAEPLTEDQANAKIEEYVKEFWVLRDLEEADTYFPA